MVPHMISLVPIVVFPVGHVLFINPFHIVTAIDVEVQGAPGMKKGEKRACTDIMLTGAPPMTVFGDLDLVLRHITGDEAASHTYIEEFVKPAQSGDLAGVFQPPPQSNIQTAGAAAMPPPPRIVKS